MIIFFWVPFWLFAVPILSIWLLGPMGDAAYLVGAICGLMLVCTPGLSSKLLQADTGERATRRLRSSDVSEWVIEGTARTYPPYSHTLTADDPKMANAAVSTLRKEGYKRITVIEPEGPSAGGEQGLA